MNTDSEIKATLETLAAALPWDRVQLEITRAPEGALRFVAWALPDETLGFGYVNASGDTPQEAASRLLEQTKDRDPETRRKKKIADLKEQIAKLQAVVIGLPPYRPNRELAQVNLKPAPATVDV